MWWTTLALAAPELSKERVSGALDERFAGGDGASLSLLLVGEHDGRLGPCGCSTVPRGGMARLASAVAARRADDPTPDLLLHGGNWLSAATTLTGDGGELLSREALDADVVMHRALGRLPFDALNTTFRDLPGVPFGPHPGMLAANARGHGQPVVADKTFVRGAEEVVVIGVSAAGLQALQPAGTGWTDPVEAVRSAPRPGAAVVVVLAYGLGARVAELAAVPGVDVVVDTHAWQGVFEPLALGDTVVVRTPADGGSLVELRLWVEEGVVTAALQRTVPLDHDVPEDPFLAALAPDGRAD
jgi:2',3'-cyclic-nucleotide 2'-phosphodiesterase (5'-nucleotidase family)